ncbi:hypothetical protein [Thiomicrorhabdus sp.]|uniref:hypothetical protein n=1 Tax=Thiomicrorhabdus sp. TaxID=2039724 RepID=UPI003563C952
MVEAGDTVQVGQPLITFAKSNHLSIAVNVPVNLMMGISKGDIFDARLANKMPIKVGVAQIFPAANNQQHTVTVKFDLPIGTPAAPGMYRRCFGTQRIFSTAILPDRACLGDCAAR